MMAVAQILFLLLVLTASEVSGDSIFEWPISRQYFELNEGTHVWYYDDTCNGSGCTPLYGYHSGEDWNGKDTTGDQDCIESFPGYPGEIRSPYDGNVEWSNSDHPEEDSLMGYGAVIKYQMPDSTDIYMAFRHCKNDGHLHPTGPISKGDLICHFGRTAATNCHLHWDLASEPGLEDINPWYGGINTTSGNQRAPFEFESGIAKWGSPTLFLDDWGSSSVQVDFDGTEWIYFAVFNDTPSSMVYIDPLDTPCEPLPGSNCTYHTQNLRQAFDNEIVDEVRHQDPLSPWPRWYHWGPVAGDKSAPDYNPVKDLFLSKHHVYRARLKSGINENWKIVVPIPGHHEVETRARMEMIQLARQSNETSRALDIIRRVETRSFLSPSGGSEWDVWVLFIGILSNGSNMTPYLQYAANKENPLIRCIVELDPLTGLPLTEWKQITPGEVYSTPSEEMSFVASDKNVCNPSGS